MLKLIVVVVAGLVPFTPAVVYYLGKRFSAPDRATRRVISALQGLNIVLALGIIGFGLVWLASPQTVMAAGLVAPASAADPYASLAAAAASAMATISAGFAVSNTGAAALGAIAEKPEVFGRALVFVGLAEGIGIYGLIVAVLILNR
jgi:V/A-type H+/Na+-transporting ATPase subunit K